MQLCDGVPGQFHTHDGAGFLALGVGFLELSTGTLRMLLGFNQFVIEGEGSDIPVSWVASLAARSVDPAIHNA